MHAIQVLIVGSFLLFLFGAISSFLWPDERNPRLVLFVLVYVGLHRKTPPPALVETAPEVQRRDRGLLSLSPPWCRRGFKPAKCGPAGTLLLGFAARSQIPPPHRPTCSFLCGASSSTNALRRRWSAARAGSPFASNFGGGSRHRCGFWYAKKHGPSSVNTVLSALFRPSAAIGQDEYRGIVLNVQLFGCPRTLQAFVRHFFLPERFANLLVCARRFARFILAPFSAPCSPLPVFSRMSSRLPSSLYGALLGLSSHAPAAFPGGGDCPLGAVLLAYRLSTSLRCGVLAAHRCSR
jgi:hypothetical protein